MIAQVIGGLGIVMSNGGGGGDFGSIGGALLIALFLAAIVAVFLA